MTTESPEDRLWQSFEIRIREKDYPAMKSPNEDVFTHIAGRPEALAVALSRLLHEIGNRESVMLYACSTDVLAKSLKSLHCSADEVSATLRYTDTITATITVTAQGIRSEVYAGTIRYAAMRTAFTRENLQDVPKVGELSLFWLFGAHADEMRDKCAECAAFFAKQHTQHTQHTVFH